MAAVFCSKRVAGDFYDALRANSQRVLLGLFDVAGRRDDNRQVLVGAQKIFRSLGCELFSPDEVNESEALSELCHALNRGIMEAAGGVRSCPAFLACYHEQRGTLCYVNAGHTPGLLRDHDGILELPSTGLPLGLFTHTVVDAPIIGVPPGSILLLVSRGVIEAESKIARREDDVQSGLRRVKERLARISSHDSHDICLSILDDVSRHLKHEDRTAFVLRRN